MVQERLFLGSERLGAAFLVASQSASNSLMAWVCIYFFPRKSESDHNKQLNHALFFSSTYISLLCGGRNEYLFDVAVLKDSLLGCSKPRCATWLP